MFATNRAGEVYCISHVPLPLYTGIIYAPYRGLSVVKMTRLTMVGYQKLWQIQVYFSTNVTIYTGTIKTLYGGLSVGKMTGLTNGWLPTMLEEWRGQGQLSAILIYAEIISALCKTRA